MSLKYTDSFWCHNTTKSQFYFDSATQMYSCSHCSEKYTWEEARKLKTEHELREEYEKSRPETFGYTL